MNKRKPHHQDQNDLLNKPKKSIFSFFHSLPNKKYIPPVESSMLGEMFREKIKKADNR